MPRLAHPVIKNKAFLVKTHTAELDRLNGTNPYSHRKKWNVFSRKNTVISIKNKNATSYISYL